MYDLEQARDMETILRDAAARAPFRPVAGLLRSRADEWEAAIKWFEAAEGEEEDPQLVPAAVLEPGCRIWFGQGPVEVLRIANGGTGIHVAERGFGARWENRKDAASPVVLL